MTGTYHLFYQCELHSSITLHTRATEALTLYQGIRIRVTGATSHGDISLAETESFGSKTAMKPSSNPTIRTIKKASSPVAFIPQVFMGKKDS